MINIKKELFIGKTDKYQRSKLSMSVVHGSSFQRVSNAENEQFQGGKKTKRDALTNKGSNALVPKRTVLGTITNQIRVQPSRVAKVSFF